MRGDCCGRGWLHRTAGHGCFGRFQRFSCRICLYTRNFFSCIGIYLPRLLPFRCRTGCGDRLLTSLSFSNFCFLNKSIALSFGLLGRRLCCFYSRSIADSPNSTTSLFCLQYSLRGGRRYLLWDRRLHSRYNTFGANCLLRSNC